MFTHLLIMPQATSFILARQPLFLASEEWKTIPWALDPASKSQQNHLTDILVDIPGLLFRAGELQHNNDDPSARLAHLERVKATLFFLYCWRYTWELLNPDAAYETKPTAAEAKTRVIARRLHFRGSHENAAEILLYNAIQLFLLGLIEPLSDLTTTAADTTIAQQTAFLAATATSFPLSTHPRGALLLPDDVDTLRDLAIEICRAFEFQMHAPEKSRGSNLFFLFPLGIAYEMLKADADYKAWMKGMLDRTPVTSGYAVGRNRWFGKYYFPKVRGVPGEDRRILRPPRGSEGGGLGRREGGLVG